MSFEKIGPYELTRGDLIAASLVISFSTGATSTRLKATLFIFIGVLMIGGGLAFGEPQTVGFGLFFILLIFVIAPALRSRKGSEEIYLDYSPDGLVAETPDARTTYKWSTVREAKKVGSRLFIMISDGCALVISDRSTSGKNMSRLIATVAQHRGSAGL
ncbi:YcxB family protein [Sphingomonas sp. LY54]|uniref:YcxB family protein n=1 Tax=Sphingomonas sp. LY54 TaxID=3095343 RepID=UPI002D797D3F|nr:YcxB family protein [Sphingomonas sp. LY54]WRP28975.1 YcxB family protein [Sphingomonas sp. LY54]